VSAPADVVEAASIKALLASARPGVVRRRPLKKPLRSEGLDFFRLCSIRLRVRALRPDTLKFP
jgi:hypothetical protein